MQRAAKPPAAHAARGNAQSAARSRQRDCDAQDGLPRPNHHRAAARGTRPIILRRGLARRVVDFDALDGVRRRDGVEVAERKAERRKLAVAPPGPIRPSILRTLLDKSWVW